MPAANRRGECRTMKCGLAATIIAYRSAKDLDVMFSTGDIRHHCTYQNFRLGQILPVHVKDVPVDHVWERNRMKCGLVAEIIAHRRSEDLDVRFLDGSIREHCAYSHFRKGEIVPPRPEWGNFRTVAFAEFELKHKKEEDGSKTPYWKCHGCGIEGNFSEMDMLIHFHSCPGSVEQDQTITDGND